MTPPPVILEATTGDTELDAAAFIVSALSRLDTPARLRVLRWALARVEDEETAP